MALVPDEAIVRARELTPKAFVLFAIFCKYRNSESELAWPGLSTLSKLLGVQKPAVCKLRMELVEKRWIRLEGDQVTFNFSFNTERKTTPERFPTGNDISSQETEHFPTGNDISSQETERFPTGNDISSQETAFPPRKRNISSQEIAYRNNQLIEPEREREGDTRALSLVERFSETAIRLARICNLHPDTLTDKQIQSVTFAASRLEKARGFDLAMLDRWPIFWNEHMRKTNVPSRPEYVLEHFGSFLTWSKGAAA